MKLKPWIIYIWKNEDRFEGAAVTEDDGIKHTFVYGWKIEPDPEARKNEISHQEWRASTQLKRILANTLNAIEWYGYKILTKEGDIDPNRFNYFEQITAFKAYKKAKRKNVDVDINDLKKVKKFNYINITLEQAKEFGFI